MKRIIETYKKNRDIVEHFILEMMGRLHIKEVDEKRVREVFSISECVVMVYGVDSDYTRLISC